MMKKSFQRCLFLFLMIFVSGVVVDACALRCDVGGCQALVKTKLVGGTYVGDKCYEFFDILPQGYALQTVTGFNQGTSGRDVEIEFEVAGFQPNKCGLQCAESQITNPVNAGRVFRSTRITGSGMTWISGSYDATLKCNSPG